MIICSTFFQPECPPQHLSKKKKSQSYAWGEADKESQTGRRERQNLIKFNKAERIAQAVNSDSAFSSFTTSAYLNTFTPPLLSSASAFTQRAGHRGRRSFLFLFECWPRMATICANCPTLWLSCTSCHKYQSELHFSDNSHITLHLPCSALPLLGLLFYQVDTNWSSISFSGNSDFCLTSSLWHLLLLFPLFLVIKKTSSVFPETQPTLISRWVIFFFFSFSSGHWKAFH